MGFKATHNPDVIESRQGGGCFILLGLPFFLAGTAVILLGFGVLPAKNAPPWFFAIPFGLVFALVGLAIITGRSGVRLDGRVRTVHKWWSAIGFTKGRTAMVTADSRIRIQKEVRRGNKSSTTVYPVRLVGDEKDLDIETCMTSEDARSTAEQVCKHLRVDMEDLLTGQLILREHDKLDESLRERLQRTGEAVEVTDPPPGTAIQLEQDGRDLVITLPPRGFRAWDTIRLAPAIIPFAFAAVMLTVFSGQKQVPAEVKPILFAVAGVLVIVPTLGVVLAIRSKAKRWVEIRVSKERLRVTRVGIFGRKVEEVPSERLEDLVLAPDPGSQMREQLEAQNVPETVKRLALALHRVGSRPIVAVSDEKAVKFGGSLTPAEREWLYALVKRVLTA